MGQSASNRIKTDVTVVQIQRPSNSAGRVAKDGHMLSRERRRDATRPAMLSAGGGIAGTGVGASRAQSVAGSDADANSHASCASSRSRNTVRSAEGMTRIAASNM